MGVVPSIATCVSIRARTGKIEAKASLQRQFADGEMSLQYAVRCLNRNAPDHRTLPYVDHDAMREYWSKVFTVGFTEAHPDVVPRDRSAATVPPYADQIDIQLTESEVRRCLFSMKLSAP
eukprot:50922-Eustigmatos_ZCMA.PRE.1